MFLLLFSYTCLLMLAVLGGCYLSRAITPTHRRTQMAMSFVSGLMLGIAVFHLLPHALYAAESLSHNEQLAANPSIDFVAGWLMFGLISMFLLQRVFHFHQHDFDDEFCIENEHDHQHKVQSGSSSIGVFLGLGVHSIIDGVALAASMLAVYSTAHGDTFILAGLGVFLAILLHKPLDAVTIDTFMRKASLSSTKRYTVLALFSLLCPTAAFITMLGFTSGHAVNSIFVVAALAFSAGIFLCIALSDLLPEIHFHSHDRFSMTLLLLAGIMLSLGIKLIESEHSHQLNLDWQPEEENAVSILDPKPT